MFREGDLIWQTIFPIGTKDPKYGKWSQNWECPFIMHKVLDKGHIILGTVQGRCTKYRSMKNFKEVLSSYLGTERINSPKRKHSNFIYVVHITGLNEIRPATFRR